MRRELAHLALPDGEPICDSPAAGPSQGQVHRRDRDRRAETGIHGRRYEVFIREVPVDEIAKLEGSVQSPGAISGGFDVRAD